MSIQQCTKRECVSGQLQYRDLDKLIRMETVRYKKKTKLYISINYKELEKSLFQIHESYKWSVKVILINILNHQQNSFTSTLKAHCPYTSYLDQSETVLQIFTHNPITFLTEFIEKIIQSFSQQMQNILVVINN